MSELRSRIARFVVPPDSQRVPPRQRHIQMLVIATLVTLLSFVLDMTPAGGVGFFGTSATQLPPLCLSQSLFGRDCPGCGLTRSFVCLAHGRWNESIHFHGLGWLLALLILLQFPYRLLALRFPTRVFLPKPIPDLIAWGLILSLIAQWVSRIS